MSASAEFTDKFRIVKPIGRGGMGEVFLAHDIRLERDVAVKFLRSDLGRNDLRAHIAAEAQILAKLNHPNIVQVYDIIESDGATALVMEYVDGQNLHILLRERSPDTPEMLRWLSEIAAGIAAAHSVGVVHNDLKAENVLVNSANIAKVTDFGIAGTTLDPREDIYALGRLANSMLDSQAAIPPNLSHLLQQLSHPDAAKRPTATEAATSLRRAWLESTQQETALPEI